VVGVRAVGISNCLCQFPVPPVEVRFTAADTSIQFLRQPASANIVLQGTATFEVEARAVDAGGNPLPLTYQWQTVREHSTEWTDLAGATSPTYIASGSACAAVTPWNYRCRVSAGAVTAFSDIARLHVISDCSPPSIVSVTGDPAANELTILFDRVMDWLPAQDPFNYSLVEKDSPFTAIQLIYSIRDNGREFVFQTDPGQMRAGTEYVLTAVNVSDLSDPECGCNMLPPDTQVTFRALSYECVRITQPPASRTTQIGCLVTFEAQVRWTSPLTWFSYQWFRNDQPIAGATSRTYQMGPVTLQDNGARIHYVVNLPSKCAPAISGDTTLSVLAEASPLVLTDATEGLAPDRVVLRFAAGCGSPDDRLRPNLATNRANYSISGLQVLSAAVDCTRAAVELTTSAQSPGVNYTVTVSGLEDMFGNPIGAGNTATFTRSPPAPLAMGVIRWTAESRQMLLEWAGQGTLQRASTPPGPWENVVTSAGYYLVPLGKDPCVPGSAPAMGFYRVRWPAP
jgi:hypothetical protein